MFLSKFWALALLGTASLVAARPICEQVCPVYSFSTHKLRVLIVPAAEDTRPDITRYPAQRCLLQLWRLQRRGEYSWRVPAIKVKIGSGGRLQMI